MVDQVRKELLKYMIDRPHPYIFYAKMIGINIHTLIKFVRGGKCHDHTVRKIAHYLKNN